MYLNYQQIIILFILIFINYSHEQSNSDCRTPNNEPGACINIKQCPPLVTILKKPKPLSNDDQNFLFASQCGFEGRTPKVCCPQLSTNSNPSTNNLPDVTNHRNLYKINNQECGKAVPNRITNGNKTKINEFPWMALLGYRSGNEISFRCGGSLINEQFVLTAAHCITNLKSDTKLVGVRLGEHNIDTISDCELNSIQEIVCNEPVQDFTIAQIISHSQYSPKTFSNDIGLLKLNGRPNLRPKNVNTICLPVGEYRVLDEPSAIVAGWGVTETGRSSPILLKVNVPFVSIAQCNKIYRGRATITEKHLCAGGSGGHDSCSGDSGGPLMFPSGDNGHYHQFGIVSFGLSVPFCGTDGNPGVYTNVAYYMDWILDNMS